MLLSRLESGPLFQDREKRGGLVLCETSAMELVFTSLGLGLAVHGTAGMFTRGVDTEDP